MARDERMIAALRRERAGYVARGDADRVAQVDRQLAHYGYQPEPDPAQTPPQDPGPVPQRTAEGAPAERDTAEQGKTARRGRGRPKLPRDGDGNIVRE